MEDGNFLTAIDLGEGTILLKSGISKVDTLSKRIVKNLKKDKATIEDIFVTLEEERKKYYDEKYGK